MTQRRAGPSESAGHASGLPPIFDGPVLPAKRARTRAALVDAALTLIAERGAEAASIDDLVRQAGMARGTFYNYFPTWHDLLVAVAQRMSDQYVARVDSRLQAEADAATILACMVRGMIHSSLEDPRLGWAWVRMGPQVHALLGDRPVAQSRSKEVLRSLPTLDASEVAVYCVLGGTVFATIQRLLEKQLTFGEIDSIVAMVLRGLGIPESQIPAALLAGRRFADVDAVDPPGN